MECACGEAGKTGQRLLQNEARDYCRMKQETIVCESRVKGKVGKKWSDSGYFKGKLNRICRKIR